MIRRQHDSSEMAKQQANLRNHMVEESKNEYASQLQKYNKDQNQFYFVEMPHVFNKLQEMDEKRIQKLCEAYKMFADTERQVMPIIGKCLDGMTKAAESVNESGVCENRRPFRLFGRGS
eukprot:g30014.t1